MLAWGERRLRVALATESREPSGVGAHMLLLARYLDCETTILAFDDVEMLDRARRAGLSARALGSDWRADFAGFDIVHIHAGIGWEGPMLAWAAHGAGVGAIVRTEHLPWIVDDPEQLGHCRDAEALVDARIAVSASVADSYRDRPYTTAPVHVVENGVEPTRPTRTRAAVRASLDVPPDAPVALAAGRFTPQKGYDLLIEAARRLPDPALVLIAGDGPGLEDARAAVARTGAPVRLLGRRDDLPDLLAAADLLVIPSRFEGLPLVVLEAMAAGRAVLGTDVAGTRDAVAHGETGWLVPPEDPAVLGEALAHWLPDAQALARAGAAGRRRWAARFTAERMAAETLAAYRAALQPARTVAA